MSTHDEIEALMEYATLGEQVKSFMQSDVGKFLLARAKQEYDAGIDALKSVKPTDVAGLLIAQNNVRRAESIRGWLEEAIVTGLKALDVLEGREDS